MINPNTIRHGDCLEIMPEIEDKSIDMILCDLPYGVTACEWDSIIPLEPLWKQYKRIIKDNGAIVLTATQPFTSKLVMSNIEMFKYCWIWNKNRGTNFLNAKNEPLRMTEDIYVFCKQKTIYNPILIDKDKRNISYSKNPKRNTHNIYKIKGDLYMENSNREIPIEKGYPVNIIDLNPVNNFKSGRDHPSQKPAKLFEYLIQTYTNEKALVLDNCIGSGTTAIACIKTNRRYIGIEKEKKYYDITLERIEKEKEQLTLFD